MDDLISREAVYEAMQKLHGVGGIYLWDPEEVLAVIEKTPAVEAVEVVHGRWIAVPSSDMMTGKAYKCSECDKMRYGSFMPNYCQNCGAKMDGGEDNGC